MLNHTVTVDDFWSIFASVLRPFSAEQQRTAVTLYRELARGEPLTTGYLAGVLGVSPEGAAGMLAQDPLRNFLYTDEERIVGFGGLATAPMHHQFRVDGRTLWTWCAWDGLFIPTVLDRPAEVSSPDPQTRDLIRLTVSPSGIESVEPADAVVSFLMPDAKSFDSSAENVMAAFCHHVFFFSSRESGERWRAAHEGTLLFSLDDAFELGQRLVTQQFGEELLRRRAA